MLNMVSTDWAGIRSFWLLLIFLFFDCKSFDKPSQNVKIVDSLVMSRAHHNFPIFTAYRPFPGLPTGQISFFVGYIEYLTRVIISYEIY